MREMVLNHASLVSPDIHSAVKWLKDVTLGMMQLTHNEVVEYTLRTHRPLSETLCTSELSLWDTLIAMQKEGAREEFSFFATLASKVPLWDDLDEEIRDRFRGCGAKTLPTPDGDPLVLAAITDWISVGFPSESTWDKDQITVVFDELLADGNIGEASEEVENLTRLTHSQQICIRHLERVRRGLRRFRSGADLWNVRSEAFPNLLFGPDVESHIMALNTGLLGTVFNKLISLDTSVAGWQESKGPMPSWGSYVSDESSSVKNDRELREARRFQSSNGTSQLFLWHARFGKKGRIHLRFDPASFEVEIGYIGWHLPLS